MGSDHARLSFAPNSQIPFRIRSRPFLHVLKISGEKIYLRKTGFHGHIPSVALWLRPQNMVEALTIHLFP